jgi:hypothetical protein
MPEQFSAARPGLCTLGLNREGTVVRQCRLAFGLIVIALAATTPAAGQGSNNDHLIVPGRRIGPIALGMSAADVLRIKGDPIPGRSMRGTTKSQYTWSDLHVLFEPGRVNGVETVCALSPEYRTSQGIHVGSSDLAVMAGLGQPVKISRSTQIRGFVQLDWGDALIIHQQDTVVTAICMKHP